MKKKYKIVKIKWIDSFGGGHWVDINSYDSRIAKCTTVGYLIKKIKTL